MSIKLTGMDAVRFLEILNRDITPEEIAAVRAWALPKKKSNNVCSHCGKMEGFPLVCSYCGKLFCIDCRHPETHDCHINSIWHPKQNKTNSFINF